MSTDEKPLPPDIDRSGPAHPDAVKDFWLSVVKPASQKSRDKMPTVRGVSARGRDIARTQNQWLTRQVFSGTSEAYQRNYDRINWGHDR